MRKHTPPKRHLAAPDYAPLHLRCPMGVTVVADEWGLGFGNTYCVTVESTDSAGNPTYAVLTANIGAKAAIDAARAIQTVLRTAAKQRRYEPR